MFDTVRNNKRIVQGFLALITLPFAFWGVESYIRDAASGAELAKVGDSTITTQELGAALREQGERMRQQMGAQYDPKILESKEARAAVLDSLISKRMVEMAVRDARLGVDDAALSRYIAQIPALQEDGKFSPERYAAAVAGQGMSKEMFEMRMRQDMARLQLIHAVGDASFGSKTAAALWTRAQLETRNVEEMRFAPEHYAKGIAIDEAAVSDYYKANEKRFETPEQIRAEFLVLDQETLQGQIQVSEAEIEARYKAKQESFQQTETRRASHILIKLGKDAGDAEVKAANDKMTEVQAKLAKDSKAFADLAKKYSDDPGSAQKGGDLDWFGRGMMVKPFEDAVFSAKEGETTGVVRSDFGLHLIRVTGIKAAKVQPLAEVRAQIASELAREGAKKKFTELAESFTNTVYEQPDSLKPAAEQFKLLVQQSAWLAKGRPLPAPFDNPKLQAALFSAESLARKNNTEAIEIAPGRLVSARVVEHMPAKIQPLDVVRSAIMQQLTRDKAAETAIAEGQRKLEALRKGEKVEAKFAPARPLLRVAPAGIARDAAREIFAVEAASLPAYVGAKLPDGGYAIYRVVASKPADENDPRNAMLTQQYQRQVAENEFSAWLKNLRQRYEVKVNQKQLEATAG